MSDESAMRAEMDSKEMELEIVRLQKLLSETIQVKDDALQSKDEMESQLRNLIS